MNPSISSNINQWDLDHDPYNFLMDDEWIRKAEKIEDILQAGHVYGRLIIDVGYYDKFRAVLIEDQNWDTPVESFESEDGTGINECICRWIDHYANGNENSAIQSELDNA